MKESAVQRTGRRRLDRAGAVGIKANPTNGAGTPDWIGSYLGRALAIEFKQPGASTARGRAKLQLHEQTRWANAGAVVATVTSQADLDLVLGFVEATSKIPRLPDR